MHKFVFKIDDNEDAIFIDLGAQSRIQANSRYPSERRRLGTERNGEFTGDVTSKFARTAGDEGDWSSVQSPHYRTVQARPEIK